MTTSKELLLSLLSMDAYNRGYNQGINELEEDASIGGLRTLTRAELNISNAQFQEWQDAGFYAIAYEVTDGSNLDGFSTGDVIISYRGTDQPLTELPGVDREIAGRNNFNQDQVHLGSRFLLDVTKGLPPSANVFTT